MPMTSKPSIDRLARRLGAVLGICLAAAALISWRVPGGERTLGADVSVEALETGEVGVAPPRPFVSVPSLVPGASASGAVTLRNQTGVRLALRLRALPSTHDLDPILGVRVSSGGRTLYDGNLGGLRAAGARPLRLAPAESARIQVRASLPKGLRSGFQGRIVDVSLEIDSRRAR
jgi:hypothetical protein